MSQLSPLEYAHARSACARFPRALCHESFSHFAQRLKKVEEYMNSRAFAARGGIGLLGLAQELRPRCEEQVRFKGARLPK